MWNVGDRVRVARSLSVLALHVGKTGAVCEVSPYVSMFNDGAGRVFRVELDNGEGKWYFGSAELEPETGMAEW
jgi:hypothetical protein